MDRCQIADVEYKEVNFPQWNFNRILTGFDDSGKLIEKTHFYLYKKQGLCKKEEENQIHLHIKHSGN